MDIDKDGKVVKATCKCDYYLTYPGYCKHILAFLLQSNELTNKKGNATWECHIKSDWLLVWQQNDSTLTLIMVTTGTHSDMFYKNKR